MSLKNIDNLLVADMQDRDTPIIPDADYVDDEPNVVEQSEDNVSQEDGTENKPDDVPHRTKDKPDVEPDAYGNDEPATDKTDKTEKVEPESKSEEVDDYGNPVAKSRTYTEEEVQRMIRDRLSRGRNAEQSVQQQAQPAPQSQADDVADDDDWEVALDRRIDKRLETKQEQAVRQNWEHEQNIKQAQFEEKFNVGMSKYKDFDTVVVGKPITNRMLMAARTFEDPAGFIYAAAKTQAKELERIARLNDPLLEAAEIGRLEERMRKVKASASKAGKPLTTPKGDVTDNRSFSKRTLDDKIQADASKRLKSRR